MEISTDYRLGSDEQQNGRLRCFVISPIGAYGSEIRKHMDIVFHCIIEPALADRYEVVRGDHVAKPGRITEQFIDDIIGNDLIVCVLTGNNPNVYYELAIAESAARPIIVLRHRDDEVPFDVKDIRFIEYDLDPRRIFDRYYVKTLQRAERELTPGEGFDGKVPFAPHLTPLGREQLNFKVAERYDQMSSQVQEILSAARERFWFCGMTLRGWVANEGFLSLLKSKAEQNVDCRILVMCHESNAIGQMLSRGMSGHEDRLKNDVKETYERLQGIGKDLDNRRLGVRMVRHGIIYQQMSMSEQSMIWVPHMYSRQTGQSPAIRVDMRSSQLRQPGLSDLYTAMRIEFEQLWNENTP